VRAGGVLALMGTDHIEDIDGDTSVFEALSPESGAATAAEAWRLGREVGKGRVVLFGGSDDASMPAQQLAMLDLTYRMSDLDPNRANAMLIDEEKDGIVTTVFADRVLFYNGTGTMVRKMVHFREPDFPPGGPQPPESVSFAIPAHRIAVIDLPAR